MSRSSLPRGPGLAYAGATQRGPALEAGRQTAREAGLDEPSADHAHGLASRLRSAREARQNQHARSAPEVAPQPDASRSLADRLREAAKGVEPGAYADRAAQCQMDRLEEDRQRALDDERTKDQQRQQTHERT
ncbi:MAG: hypothetical protein ACK47C_04765 [Paracoccaceae bacterium]|jgi:hypothetical protein